MTPRFLLDENTAPPTGGGGSPASAQVSGTPGDGAPTSPIPDSPAEPAAQPSHDAFAGMEDNDFDLVEVQLEDGPQPGEGGKPPPPQAAPEEPKPATAAQPAPQVPPQPAQPPAANEESAPRSPLDQAIDGFRTNHKELSVWASQNLFALTPEDAEGLETDVAKLIPVLMGRVYSQALQATTNLIKNFVPNMINEGVASSSARSAKAQEALNEFYTSHPHLNPQQHGALVDKWARAYRAANPSASRTEAIKFVGQAVSAEIGAHVAPAGGNGARPAARPAPFAPARPGARVQQPTPPHDPYEGMDMEFDQE